MTGLNTLNTIEGSNQTLDTDLINVFNTMTVGIVREKRYVIREVDHATANRYRGDFIGLLSKLEIPYTYYYLCLCLNNLDSSEEYGGVEHRIKLPTEETILDISTLLT